MARQSTLPAIERWIRTAPTPWRRWHAAPNLACAFGYAGRAPIVIHAAASDHTVAATARRPITWTVTESLTLTSFRELVAPLRTAYRPVDALHLQPSAALWRAVVVCDSDHRPLRSPGPGSTWTHRI
ncbi:hypothetical protein A4G27_11590 [Mycobacterium kansasii]|nr:hypothetical protein A4G27_11590 [Mycobacterium kansasii]